jgi:outer membrane protein
MPLRVGDNGLTGPQGSARPVKACVSTCAAFGFSIGAACAADLTSSAPVQEPAPILPSLSGWYVKAGAMGVWSRSSSNLYSQALAEVPVPGGFLPIGVGPPVQVPGRSAYYSNIFTAAVMGGYYFTPNWSVEVEGGFPVWSDVHVTGPVPPGGGPPAGTLLAKVMPAGIPITGVYHFTQFGGFQPYLGAGVLPTFALAVRDGYVTGGSYQPALGVVVQGGFDYMFDKHWGVFFDAKQSVASASGSASGINVGPPLGIISASSWIKTTAKPVSFSTGITYRF